MQCCMVNHREKIEMCPVLFSSLFSNKDFNFLTNICNR
jgi:hypothetical protein